MTVPPERAPRGDDAATIVTGWLKRSLEDASQRVAAWPEWKRALEEATTTAYYERNRPCRMT